MKSTGIIRRVDELGRIVLPIEIRKNLSLSNKDAIEIFVDGEDIILRRYEPSCIFCGSMDEGKRFRNKVVCNKCFEELQICETKA